MRRIHPAGLFEAICPLPEQPSQRYQLRVAGNDGEETTMHDPYSFPHLLTDYDLYLLERGPALAVLRQARGAVADRSTASTGVNFAVWAPNATSVSVVGDFNDWDGRRHPMRKHIPSGFWELFVPGLGRGHALQVPDPPSRSASSRRPIRSASPPRCRRARPRRWPT